MQNIPSRQRQFAIRGDRDATGLAAWWNFAWRAFGIWRERARARATLAKMTERELADIGMTRSDRDMTLRARVEAIPVAAEGHDISAPGAFGSGEARKMRDAPNSSKRTPA
jgi:uncharacterized protein YjiS (DUF1127 family)